MRALSVTFMSWKLTNAVISKMEKRENAHDPIRCTIFGVLYNKVFDDIRGLQCIGGLIQYRTWRQVACGP
jgi:hypothetical protein